MIAILICYAVLKRRQDVFEGPKMANRRLRITDILHTGLFLLWVAASVVIHYSGIVTKFATGRGPPFWDKQMSGIGEWQGYALIKVCGV